MIVCVGAQTPVSGGLSALVEAQLGRALDKSLQCSAWEKVTGLCALQQWLRCALQPA